MIHVFLREYVLGVATQFALVLPGLLLQPMRVVGVQELLCSLILLPLLQSVYFLGSQLLIKMLDFFSELCLNASCACVSQLFIFHAHLIHDVNADLLGVPLKDLALSVKLLYTILQLSGR
jgi:hypothetical protein